MIALLGDGDKDISAAAAAALGAIGSPEAAKALSAGQAKAPDSLVLSDACLACAEKLLADEKKPDALAIYKALMKSPIKHVKLGATRGLMAALQPK